MIELFPLWIDLLNEHEKLLSELETHLVTEKRALLDNNISCLQDCTTQKQASLSKITEFQTKFSEFQKTCAKDLGDEKLPLSKVLEKFPTIERRQLQKKREDLARKSRSIERINKFNESCLKVYIDQTKINQNVLNFVQTNSGTYGSDGKTSERKSGRILNRSF